MLSFNYRARVSDPNGQDICAIVNPDKSDVRFSIKKVLITTSSRSRVLMIVKKDGQVSPDETVLEGMISTSDPEDTKPIRAIAILRPDMPEPWASGRFFTIPDAGLSQIATASDDIVIPPGYRLGIRVIPYEVGQQATVDISFKQEPK